MSTITVSDLLVRQYSPQIITGFGNRVYAARQILPPIKVNTRATQIATFGSDYLREQDFSNDGRTEAAEINDSMTYVSLDPKFYAGAKTLSQDELDEWPSGIAAVQYAFGAVTSAMQIQEERALAAAMVTSGNYTLSNYDTPGTKWGTSGGDPVADFNSARAIVMGNVGVDPNVLAVSWKTHLVLADFARDSLGGNASYRMPTTSDLAAYYGFQDYIVLSQVYNSAIEGQTNVLAKVWGDDNAFLLYRPPTPRSMEPAFGYTIFIKNEMNQKRIVKEDPQHLERFLVNGYYQSKVLSYGAAFWWYTVL